MSVVPYGGKPAVPNPDDGLPVKLPSGAVFYVHPEELDWMSERVQRYTSENHFTNISDLQDVDRMLMLELLCFRWALWINRQRDYWGDPVPTVDLQKAFKEASAELRQIKKLLGIDKLTRERDQGADSPPVYIAELKRRGKEFGVHRDEMLAKGIEIFQKLSSLVTWHFNCTLEEQKENHITAEDIVTWLRDEGIPEFEAVDKHFRTVNQKMWIRRM